ncbi:hypothetical protein J3E68DRAFT_437570 [Trichoderma sp. SZMC 28012]
MKFTTPTILTLGCLLSKAAADFHIGAWLAGDNQIGGVEYNAICPSDYWNCQCFVQGDRRYDVYPRIGELGSGYNGDPTFWWAKNVCGVSQLNFYYLDSGIVQGYIDGGDGSVVANCYHQPPGTDVECDGNAGAWLDWWVCYSYICNP